MARKKQSYLINTEKYEKTKIKYDAALEKVKNAKARLEKINLQLRKDRKSIIIECSCGERTPVSEVELIREYSNGYQNYNDDYTYRETEYWVCKGCTEVFEPPKDDCFMLPSIIDGKLKNHLLITLKKYMSGIVIIPGLQKK